jgi:hypothetical protein
MSRLLERAALVVINGFRTLSTPKVGQLCESLDGNSTLKITKVNGFRVKYIFLSIEGNLVTDSGEYSTDWVHAEHNWLRIKKNLE